MFVFRAAVQSARSADAEHCALSLDRSVVLTIGYAAPQGDLNLNIAEAHAFNTTDKFSLDVFVVNGWTGQVHTVGGMAGEMRLHSATTTMLWLVKRMYPADTENSVLPRELLS